MQSSSPQLDCLTSYPPPLVTHGRNTRSCFRTKQNNLWCDQDSTDALEIVANLVGLIDAQLLGMTATYNEGIRGRLFTFAKEFEW